MRNHWMPVSAVALLLLSGCARTRVAGFTDPDYQGRSFSHPAILAGASNLLVRQELESAMLDKLRRLKIPAESTLEICPPTREFTAEERNALLKQRGVDALIVITVDEEGVEKSYVPVYGTTTTTTGSVSSSGNATSYKEETTTRVNGGYETSEPWARMTTRIVDTSNGRTAWIAGSASEGTAYATVDMVYDSYFVSVLKEMIHHGVLKTDERLSVLEAGSSGRSGIGGQ